jgi:hypothetical protein
MGPREELTGLANRVSARTALRISAVALALELSIAVTTFLPGAPLVPQALPLLLFPGVFVVHFRSVMVLAGEGKPDLRTLLRRVPRTVSLAFVVLFFGCWLVGIDAIAQIGGQPTLSHGQYFLNDHGSMIAVSHSVYLHAVVLEQRIFTLIPAVFYALGVLVNIALIGDHRAQGDQSPTRPSPDVRDRPAPG